MMTVRGRLVDTLTAHVSPTLLAPLGSVLVSAQRREPCLVSPTDGGWIHRYRQGIVVAPRLGGPSARLQDESARDHFLHAYEPRPGDVVFDVGAGVGGEVRLFSRLVGPTGRVVSVEAHPTTYRFLARTVALNRLSNVTTLQLAMTEAAGTVYIEDDAEAHLSNGLTTNPQQGIPVPARTLEQVMNQVGVDRINLLKLNIEGAELAVLRSGADTLHRVDNIVVSCHDFKATRQGTDWQRTFEAVGEQLRRSGFTLRTRPNDVYRPWIRYYLYGSR